MPNISQNSIVNNLKISEALSSLDDRIRDSHDASSRETQKLKRDFIATIHSSRWNAVDEADITKVSATMSGMASRDRIMALDLEQSSYTAELSYMRDRSQRISEADTSTLEWIFSQTDQGSRPGKDIK